MKGRAILLALLMLAGMAGPAAADAIYAEVNLNGRPTGRVIPFEVAGEELSTEPDNLRELGLAAPPAALQADGRIPLSALPGVKVVFRSDSQAVDIIAQPPALTRDVIAPAPVFIPPDPAAWGGLVNYAVSAVQTAEGQQGASATLEVRAFGPPGVLSSSWLVEGGDLYDGRPDQRSVRRLDTTFVRDEPLHSRRWAAGDFVAVSQSWSRPLRGAGLSLATDFSLRPELITMPMPQLRGAPSVPSTVDLYIDGLRRLSEPTTGPFDIQQPPVFTGRGQISMVVTDTLGRQSVQTFDFYGSDRLLRRGLAAYAVEAGWLRRDYAGPHDRYTEPFAQAQARYGVNDALTLEGRIAGAEDLVEVGGGAVFKVREAAVLAAAVNLTSGRRGEGGLWRLAVERDAGRYSVYGAISRTFGDFEDLALRAGDLPVDLSVQAGASVSLDRLGALNLNYTRQKTGPDDFGVVNVSWNRSFQNGIDFYVTGYASVNGADSNGVSVGFVMPLGVRGTAGGRISRDSDGQTTAAATAWRPPPLDGGWGWRVAAEGGAYNRIEGEVRRTSRIGEAALAVAATDEGVSAQGFASGAVVWLAGSAPRPAAAVGQSFALVEVGMAGIDIAQENRVVGHTGRDGRLLLSELGAFAPTRLAIVPGSAPLDVELLRTEAFARPPRGAGVVVRLPVRPSQSLNIRLRRADGKPVALGASVTLDGRPAGMVGYDGMVWLTGLRGPGRLEVSDAAGTCLAATPAPAPADGARTLELTCHAP